MAMRCEFDESASLLPELDTSHLTSGRFASGLAHHLVACAILAISLAVTLWTWGLTKVQLRQHEQARFDRIADRTAAAIRQRVLAQQVILEGLRGLVSGSGTTDESRFRTYVDSLGLRQNFPGVKGLGFCPALAPIQGAGHPRALAVAMEPPYQPIMERAATHAAEYRAAKESARLTGQPARSGRLHLASGEQQSSGEQQWGFLWFVPVYRMDAPYPGAQSRVFMGWVYAPVNTSVMLSVTLGQGFSDIDVQLYDGVPPTQKHLLMDLDGEREGHPPDLATFYASRSIEVGGHPMVLVFRSLSGFDAAGDRRRPQLTLLGGMAVSFALSGLVWSLLRTHTRATRMARGMTEALRCSEERFRSVVNTTPAMHWMSGPDKLCNYFNRAWLEFRGRTMEQESGNGWTEGVHPDDLERCLRIYVTAFEARQAFSMEYRLRRADGEYRWILDLGVPRYAHDETFIGYIGSCLDITQRKGAEEALRDREQRLRAVFDNAGVGIVEADFTGRFVAANERMCRIVRRSREELLTLTVHELTHPEDRCKSDRLNGDLAAGRTERFANEKRYLRGDGSPVWVRVTVSSVRDEAGRFLRAIAVVEDISERKQTEDVLRSRMAAIDAAADMVFITDGNGTIEYVNPAFTATTGYSAAEAIGKMPHMLQSDYHSASFYESIWRQIRAGQVWRGELISRRKDGSVYPEETTITPIVAPDGRIPQFVAIGRDITVRKEQESQERERQSLQKAVAAMEQVLGIVGHELRTPLAGLRAISEFLVDERARETAEWEIFLQQMNGEVVRMTDIVNNLLEAARLNSGRAQWQWGEVPLGQVCAEAVETVRPLVDSQQVHLSLRVLPKDAVMNGDADAIRRLVVNLVSNARKHTTEGRIEIDIRLDQGREGRWAEIRVSDTGEGIPPAIVARLGEAFALNSGVVGINHVEGTGLGLAICKGIAVAHGGFLAVQSVEGVGTTITARLRADLDGPAQENTRIRLVAEVTGA